MFSKRAALVVGRPRWEVSIAAPRRGPSYRLRYGRSGGENSQFRRTGVRFARNVILQAKSPLRSPFRTIYFSSARMARNSELHNQTEYVVALIRILLGPRNPIC